MANNFLQGRHLTTLTVTPLTVASNGTVSAGAAENIRAYFLDADPTFEQELEDIRPTWSLQRNMVPVSEGESLRLGLLQRQDAKQWLTKLIKEDGYRHFRIQWVQGTETFTGDYVLARWNGGVKNRGANPLVVELEPFDNGGTQVTYSYSA